MERVVRPSSRYQVNLALSWLLIVGLGLAPFALLGLTPDLGWLFSLIWLLACVLVLAIIGVCIPFYYRSISYEVGESEVIVHKGLITKTTKTVPYRRVTNIELKRGPFNRILGTGTIALHTAGYSQQGGPEASLVGLEDYTSMHEALLERVRASGAISAEEELASGQQVLRDLLAELRGLRKDVTFKRGD